MYTLNFHTNPYSLASSRLLSFWAPCGFPESRATSFPGFSPTRPYGARERGQEREPGNEVESRDVSRDEVEGNIRPRG